MSLARSLLRLRRCQSAVNNNNKLRPQKAAHFERTSRTTPCVNAPGGGGGGAGGGASVSVRIGYMHYGHNYTN